MDVSGIWGRQVTNYLYVPVTNLPLPHTPSISLQVKHLSVNNCVPCILVASGCEFAKDLNFVPATSQNKSLSSLLQFAKSAGNIKPRNCLHAKVYHQRACVLRSLSLDLFARVQANSIYLRQCVVSGRNKECVQQW